MSYFMKECFVCGNTVSESLCVHCGWDMRERVYIEAAVAKEETETLNKRYRLAKNQWNQLQFLKKSFINKISWT